LTIESIFKSEFLCFTSELLMTDKNICVGSRVPLSYEGRDFEAIVIDPNGLGKNQPSVGFGFGMMEKYGGLPSSTSDNWLEGLPNTANECLKLPSGSTFRVSRILGTDNNLYVVLEISDWVSVAADVLKKPGKVKKSTLNSLIDFLSWFAVKGFYADAYAVLKGAYTEADSRSVSAWMQARLMGISRRNRYTQFLQEQGCEEWYEYANWTDYVYQGLFGMKKKQMVEAWELVEGTKTIGRNYIPEPEGLNAVAYCENQVIELFCGSLQQSHDDAISFAKKKFKLDFSKPPS
jgi:hypothetical protein